MNTIKIQATQQQADSSLRELVDVINHTPHLRRLRLHAGRGLKCPEAATFIEPSPCFVFCTVAAFCFATV